MYRSILLTGKKVLTQSSLAPSSTVSRLSLNQTQRFISSSSLRLNDKKKDQQQQPSSILTDDLLDKIGVEVNEKPQAAEAAKDKEGSSDSEPQAEAGKEGGAQPRKRRNVQSSTDIKRERYANLFYLGFLFAGIGSAGYLAREWDDNSEDDLKIKEDIPNGYALDSMWKRFNARFNSIFTYFQEPPFPDLLPDSPPEPYKRPLTLVLTLEDLLIHSEWSSQNGWKTAKRPGVDYFLGYLSQYYEIVLFSSNYMMYSERIVEKLDPLRAYISYQLYKEHCLYKDGAHIKDLSKLNRDLSKTFIIDNDENAIKLQPENAIKLEKWDGKPDDYLIRMIPFLEYLATQQVKDVRPILASFKDQTKIPEEFEQRVAKLRADFDHDQAKKSGSFLNSILGLPSAKAKFPLDLIHDEGVRNFTHFQKLIKEEEEKMKQQANMPKETFKLKDLVEGNLPSQEEMMKRQLEKQAEFEKQQQQQQQQKA